MARAKRKPRAKVKKCVGKKKVETKLITIYYAGGKKHPTKAEANKALSKQTLNGRKAGRAGTATLKATRKRVAKSTGTRKKKAA